MDSPFVVIPVILATLAILGASFVYSVRKLREGSREPEGIGDHAAESVPGAWRHDPATTEQLKRFFAGKECAVCRKSIPPVHRTGLKPGLLHSTTREIRSWDEIPDADVPSTLESHLPVCADCRLAESFRQRFPDRVVDRHTASRGVPSP